MSWGDSGCAQVTLLKVLGATHSYRTMTRFKEVLALAARKVTSSKACCSPGLFLHGLEIGCGKLAYLRCDLLLVDIMRTLKLPWLNLLMLLMLCEIPLAGGG